MYGEPDIVLSFIRYAYWVMSVEADVCNYCKFVFDMARFTYTSINYTRGTSLRSEVPLVFVCSKSSTRVDGYNAPLKVGCSKSREIKVSGSTLAAEICAGPHNRLLRRQHCSSLCSQSEGHEHVANMTNALGHDFVGFSALAWPPQYSSPSLCEQSELQCFAPGLRRTLLFSKNADFFEILNTLPFRGAVASLPTLGASGF